MFAWGFSVSAAAIISLRWDRFIRKRKKTLLPTASTSIDRLDPTARIVLSAVARREPFTLGEIPGITHQAAQDCLDRLGAMGILKCELTVSNADPEGRTVWSVYPAFKGVASKL